MNKGRKLFIITLTFLILVGLTVISATDIDGNKITTTETNQATIDTTTQAKTVTDDTTGTIGASASQTDNINETTNSQETINDKTGNKTQNLKEGRTETATNYADLNSYLTNNVYDTVTIDIGSDIQLAGSIKVNNTIKNLTINGNGKTINGVNRYQFLIVEHLSQISINNITINKCYSETYGGAIYTYLANLTLNNCTFTSNSAKHHGGAVYAKDSKFLINNSTFLQNNATWGGAISNYNYTNLTITNSTFRNNVASNYGGAIDNWYVNLIVNDSNFTNNKANYGGTINNRHTINVTINNCILTNSTATYGGAIRNWNGNILIKNSNFSQNHANKTGGVMDTAGRVNLTINNCSFTFNNAENGGAIYITNDTNLSISQSNITYNNATRYGGAIHLNTNGALTVTNSNLSHNAATQGGAIYGLDNMTVVYTNFTSNNASFGGAIYGSGNMLVTNTSLTNNYANNYGGAIYNEKRILALINSTLNNNTAAFHGGAIYGSDNITITNSNITNNNVNHGSGGAIYGLTNLTITNTKLTNNYANRSGGAIYGESNINITLHNNTINNNTINLTGAYARGGAVYARYFSTIIVTNTNFTNNSAKYGGALLGYTANITVTNSNFTNNSKKGWGGAIFGDTANITVTNSNFINNNADNGGAIYGNTKDNITVINTNFTSNNASYGGAIYARYYPNITVTNAQFTYNNAFYGGAIYESNGNLTVTNTNFTNNNATYHGGAISGWGNITVINTNFTNNNANSSGGAIYADTNSNLNITNSNLIHNNANSYGGALYGFTNSTLTVINTNLTNNNASYGGVIYGYYGNINLKNSNVKDNYVSSNTGYVVDLYNANSIIITDNTFINNTNNIRDMLFNNAKKDATVDIHGNSYIDNYLEVTIVEPDVDVVTDGESKSYDYYVDLKLRDIYNDTVRNGTLKVYVNGVLKDTTNVTNGRARIFFGNSDLTKRENNITLEYISQSKHYQNATTTFTVKKEINTILGIRAPTQMNAGDTAVINFTLKDTNNNPLSDETIHVLVDEEQVATIITGDNGVASYTFNAFGDELVRIEATHHTSSDSFYLSAADAVAWIDVDKTEPEIFISHGSVVPHVETNITIRLFDVDGNPIKNKTLIVNITEEGKPDLTGTVTTDENGIAVFNFTPVDEGTLNITVTSPSDDIYHYANESVQVSKNFITTNLIVTASSMKINQTNTISVEVLADDGVLLSGNVELNIGGEIHTLNVNNGRGTYHDYKSEAAGEKNVTAKFTSNIPGYANATKTVEFNVGKLPTRVTIEAVNRTAGNVTLKVRVFPKDNTDSIVDCGNIVIESVDGENRKVIYNGTLENGELIYLTDVNETGWYEFETEYYGNEYFYGEENNTGSLEVLLANTKITTFDKTAIVGETITLNSTVTDENENPVNDGTVTFHIDGTPVYHADGTPVEAKVENGIATTEYTLPVTYTKGNYTITANYLGNNKYNISSGDAELSIELQETSMNITPVNNTKANTTIEVTLNTTDDNKPINGAEIIVTDENGTIVGEGITDENGTAIITIDIPVGDNNITITYPGDDEHEAQEETITVNVTPRESETTGTVTNNTVGNVTIDVQVVDPETGEPVTGPVKIILDDEVVGAGDLDENGTAIIPVDIDKKGNYTIIVEYEGNNDYNGSTYTLDDTYIAGKDANVTIIIDNPTVENTTVNVTITDPETNEPIPNATVIITLPNGTTVNGTTDENGTITIPIDVPSGDNNITITYPGDDEHEAKEENITIRVKSYTVVTVNPVEGIALDNVTFTANVHDYLNNPVTGGYVQFSVGGKTLKDENGKNIRVFVENGIAKLSYKAESGWIIDSHPDLKVQAVFTGTSLAQENRSDTNKVTIYKRNATVTVSAPDDYVNGTLHIDAVVRDQNGSLINDGVLVFKLNGLSVKDENNKGIVAQVVNGRIHLDVKLPFAYSAKTYNLTTVYSNKIYNKATGSNTTSLKAIPTYVNATVTIKDQFSKPVVTGQIYNKFNDAILEGTAIINIKFDGISYAKKVKVENGTFSETLEGISIYKPGTHKVEVVAGANSHYNAVRQTITTKTTPKYNVNTEFISITRNKTTTRVQAKIVDDKNKNVQRDLSITIKLNGKSFLVNKTVTGGIVDVLIDTSTLSNKNYTLELVSGANTYYNAGKATTELPKY